VVAGIPVPYFGLAFFLAMGALCIPQAWASSSLWIVWCRLLLSVAGIVAVLHLVYAELFDIKKICLWCTGVHLITLALFVIIITSSQSQHILGHLIERKNGG
jgi:uncharacterized membrane protein